MKKFEKKMNYHIKTLIVAKKFSNALVFLSLGVILISILVFYFSITIQHPRLNDILQIVRPPQPPFTISEYFQKSYLQPFIIPSIIILIIITPISITLGKRLKILIAPHTDQITGQNLIVLKMRIRHNFLFRNYKGLYFKTYAPKKFHPPKKYKNHR
jgi:hypothetical protein